MLKELLVSLCLWGATPTTHPHRMTLVTPVGMWNNWFGDSFSRAVANREDLPVTGVIFMVRPEDSFLKVSRVLYEASELGLRFTYGVRHAPESVAESYLVMNRAWHHDRVRELQVVNVNSYAVDASLSWTLPEDLDEVGLFSATQPWTLLHKALYVRGSPGLYTRSIILQARRTALVYVLDDSTLDYESLSAPDVTLDGLLQYWSGHRAIYVPGLNLAYRNDAVVMKTMSRFGEVWFFPRPARDDLARFGTSAWKPRK